MVIHWLRYEMRFGAQIRFGGRSREAKKQRSREAEKQQNSKT